MDLMLTLLPYIGVLAIGIMLGLVSASLLMANRVNGEDTARLDWLERSKSVVGLSRGSWGVIRPTDMALVSEIKPDLRAAIDSARLELPPKKP